ncbi:MAG: amidohydrolase family protein, partial [Gemmatimonadetes bacterium]|nr:amidohydrolase family protein [Gemmatimonadota bacterium]
MRPAIRLASTTLAAPLASLRHAMTVLAIALAFGLGPLAGSGLTQEDARVARTVPIYENPVKRATGPYGRLVIRNAMVIDGTGAPGRGPYDIVIERNRIAALVPVGLQGLPDDRATRPPKGDRELDATGMFVIPGFVNTHAHVGPYSVPTFNTAYIYKLWLGHGITTVRDVGSLRGLDWTVGQARAIAAGEIEGPELLPYGFMSENIFVKGETPEDARAWVRKIKAQGAVGIKLHSGPAELVEAVIREAKVQGMPTTMHHAQVFTPQATVLQTATWGLGSMEHFWYGLPEALFTDRSVQSYPVDHNYDDEQDRFQGAARIWSQAAPPFSPKWNAVMDSLLELGFSISPTFAVKSATLDVMAARRAEWHDEYAMPWQWEFFRPSRRVHGSFWFDWTSRDEAAAYDDYRLGMIFVNEYKNRGGRVTTGEDPTYALCLTGFCYVRELELLQRAGFSALEVIRAATKSGADLLGVGQRTGTVQTGKQADLVVVDGDPLHNLKVFYGTGAVRLNDRTGRVERHGGVRWTIKGGVVYDARGLLEDVRGMVREAKQKA